MENKIQGTTRPSYANGDYRQNSEKPPVSIDMQPQPKPTPIQAPVSIDENGQ